MLKDMKTMALIGLAVSVLAGSFIIADAILRTAPRYSMTDAGALLRLDIRTGAIARCSLERNTSGEMATICK